METVSPEDVEMMVRKLSEADEGAKVILEDLPDDLVATVAASVRLRVEAIRGSTTLAAARAPKGSSPTSESLASQAATALAALFWVGVRMVVAERGAETYPNHTQMVLAGGRLAVVDSGEEEGPAAALGALLAEISGLGDGDGD